ncbi:MAG: o-succinylbenzoate--CoA ligase [Candidatus Zixiibacteriota bacterium]
MKIVYPTIRLLRSDPDRIAAVDANEKITYGELEDRIHRDAERLLGIGVGRGDRIAVAATNSLEWVSLVHASARIGAILAPLNTRLSPADLRRLIPRINPSVLLADAVNATRLFVGDLDDSIQTIALDTAVAGWGLWSDATEASAAVPESVELDDICTIVATSGSSGDPKLVALSYGNLYFSAIASAINLGHRPTDRWLINLPLYHVGGLSIIHRAAVSGFSVYMDYRFDSDRLLDVISKNEITHLSVVGTMLTRVLDSHRGMPCPGSVRAILVGGAATDPRFILSARAAGYPVLTTYGMSETASQAATQSPSIPDQPVNAARPLPLCNVDIRHETGTSCARGEAGSICVGGPMVAAGYWQTDGTVTPLLEDGWFVTEDLGVLDDQGLLHVLGRRDDVIISGGENVSLREIENTAILCPGVRRVAALAVEDDQWGQSSALFVEAVDAIDAETILTFLREHIAHYKLPKHIVVTDKLPTTALDKIDRSALAVRLAHQSGQQS